MRVQVTIVREELASQIRLRKQRWRRRPKKCDDLGEMSSAAIGVVLRIMTSEQVLALESVPNL